MDDDRNTPGGPPLPPSPLIGRDGETARARALLGSARLVTLIGTGGAGKTRLAIELALGLCNDYPDGAVFVDLAPLTDAAQVLPAVARTLGLRDAGVQPLAVTLLHHLRDRHVLLVLDNVEHVLDAATGIADLLARCPGVRVLATSRAPLRAPGEHLLAVDPLPVPDFRDLPAPAELAGVASVALFVARVRESDPDFALDVANARTVAEICLALDGLPLALELAAAQVRAYGLDEVLTRTRARFDLLHLPRRAVTPRHRSLAGAVRWSIELLDEPAERLFRRLSVFAGGWTAEAARQVCGEPGQDVLPALAALVDHSLVVRVPTGAGLRYRMLETLREYATVLLTAAAEQDATRRRLLLWCSGLAPPQHPESWGEDEITRLDRAEAEFDNITAALDGAAPEDTAHALRTAATLYRFWDGRGYLGEGRRHLERLLGRPQSAEHPVEQAQALDTLGLVVLWQDEHAAARTALARSAAISEQLGNTERVAWSTSSIVISRYMSGEVEDVAPMAERAVALARTADVPGTLSRTTCALGLLRLAQGRRDESLALLRESLALTETMGYTWGRGKLTYFLGWCAYLDRDVEEASRLLQVSVAAYLEVDDRRSLPDAMDVLGCLAAAAGAHTSALRLFAATGRLRATAGSRRHRYLRPHCDPAEEVARSALGPVAAARVVGPIEALPIGRVAAAALAPDPSEPSGGVTPREVEVALLVADGLTNRQIGRRLGISERTAERHVENLRGKLGVRTRAQVAAWVVAVPTAGE